MIEIIPQLPDHVLGFRAFGKVTGSDYEQVLIPAVDKALKTHLEINLVYHIGEDFEGFDATAVWDDAKVGLQHLTAWNRIAVVTDLSWIRTAIKAVGFVMPCEVQLYSHAQLDEALAWASDPIDE